MTTESLTLQGRHVRLEPLEHHHVDGLVAAAADDASLYQWSPVPRGRVAATSYVDTALAWRDAATEIIINVGITGEERLPSEPRKASDFSREAA